MLLEQCKKNLLCVPLLWKLLALFLSSDIYVYSCCYKYPRTFWCRKKQSSILIAGLMALNPERKLRYQLICKEITGTKSFIDVLIYLQLPQDVFHCVGRLISDGEASKPGQSTNRDLPHTVRQKRMPECDLLVITGGTHTSDRASYWPKLEKWQRNLAFTVVDKAQQFGTDQEVTAIATLPPTSFILWTGDAQQTPGGIAKGTINMPDPDNSLCLGDLRCGAHKQN